MINQNVQIIPVTMPNTTVEKAEEMTEKLHSASFSDTVRMAINLADEIIKYSEQGKKIFIEGKWGEKIELKVRGKNYKNYNG